MGSNETQLVLYSFPYSICSIMVRYAFACRGEPRNPSKKLRLDIKDIDIMNGGQFDEHYLCDVNKNGEVPVLITEDGKPMPESIDITLYFAKYYPSLLPEQHRAEIEKRLEQLHTISFFALTFTGQPGNQLRARKFLVERLEDDISPRYREAIEHKLKRIDKNKLGHLTDDQVNASIERSRKLLQDVEGLLAESDTDWCFSLKQPSALDAHLVVFLARLQDVNREELIPERVKRYAEKAMQGEAWKECMQGRRTRP